MDKLTLIKNSFEDWYNHTNHTNVSVAINYSDEQTLRIKAYHKVTISIYIIGIKDNISYSYPLITLTENYNHGVTTEEEAKDNMIQSLLGKLYDYTSTVH